MEKATTIKVEHITSHIAKIEFTNPPVNLLTPETINRLHELVKELSVNEKVKVVIFSSSVSDYFYNHFDNSDAETPAFLKAAYEAKLPVWSDLVISISKAPFISIGLIRGRTRGGGNELALSFDLRYASREKAFFSQPEVGLGILPGGGGTERLPRLVGRDKALEAILSSQDYDADTAERYGWVTRTMADADLDGFVDKIAHRFASFDKTAITAAKNQINRATLPPDEDLISALREFVGSLSYPGFGARAPKLAEAIADKGFMEVEKELGYFIGQLNK